MTATLMLPVSKGRAEVRRAAPPTRPAEGVAPLLRLLAAAGFTTRDLTVAAAINPDILRVLVAKVLPDPAVYKAWADLARATRSDAAVLGNIIDAATGTSMTMPELTAIVQFARARHLGASGEWLLAHVRAGNRIGDLEPFGVLAPAWLVAWARTLVAPGDEVPDVLIDDTLVWGYMDLLMRFPAMPEKVIAYTLAKAPYPSNDAPTPGQWLRAAWATPKPGGMADLLFRP